MKRAGEDVWRRDRTGGDDDRRVETMGEDASVLGTLGVLVLAYLFVVGLMVVM